jgi:YidC/Oxa1 family membrane protein insertase
MNARFMSSQPATTTAPAPSEPIAAASASTPAAPSEATAQAIADLVPAASEPAATGAGAVLDAANAVIPPLQFGDLAAQGLTGFTPAGIVRSVLELIQVSTAMPWVAAIATTVLVVRFGVLPFHVRAMRNTARLQPYMPRLDELKQESLAARQSGDTLRLQRAALAQKALYDEAGVKVSHMMLGPVMTLASQLGLFFGIKTLCDHKLPQLMVGGLEWCPDLTVADPTYILPALNFLVVNASLWVGSILLYLLNLFLTSRRGCLI